MIKLMLRNHKAPLLLIAIALIVSWLNFTPGTILTGWDTLHPEFNYLLNIKRLIFGVFRPEQGLGAVAAHAHISEIPRLLILFVMDVFLPNNFVRYGYIFLTLIIGPLGVFYFLKRILEKEFKTGSILGASFMGGLFYMLNLGTLQQFVVPFEMFNTLYAFLPWILFFSLNYIYSDKKAGARNLFFFSIASFFAAPMAYAPALWYMHFAGLILFLSILSLPTILKKDLKVLRKAGTLIIVTLAVNSFWFLPHLYFLLTHSAEVQEALVNKLFSEQAFFYNKEYGNLLDLALLKSFLFSWNVYLGNGVFANLLHEWIDHLKNPIVLSSGYILSIVALLGLIFSIVKRKVVLGGIGAILLLSLFFLFNDNPPLGFLFRFLQNNLPLFKEALRFPHTKLFIHFIFSFSIFFGVGSLIISQRFKKYQIFPTVLLSGLILIFMLPAFFGNYLSPQMRIQMPAEYKLLSDYLNEKKDMGKVALLPIHSFWGWDYTDWGYQGAGFVWFDIKQPVMHRNFDRWNHTNEQFYKELSYAVYSQDVQHFEEVARKYDISYFLYDKSQIAPENDPKVLFREEIEKLLTKQSLFKKDISFGKLDLYTLKQNDRNDVFGLNNATSVGPITQILDEDKAYSIYGDYISKEISNDSLFPFRNLINNEGKVFPSLYEITNDGIKLKPNKSQDEYNFHNDRVILSDVLVSNSSLSFHPRDLYENASNRSIEIKTINPSGTLLNINGISTFNVPQNLSTTSLSLGRLMLKTNEDNHVSLYQQASKTLNLPVSYENISLRPCNDADNIDDFGINYNSEDSFFIFGKNVPLCLTIPFSNILKNQKDLPTSLLFGISYDLEINNPNAPSSICIANLENGNCLSYFYSDPTTKSSHYSYDYGILTQNAGRLGLRFSLDTTKNRTPTRVQFNNVTISFKEPSQTIIIPGNQVSSLLDTRAVTSDLILDFSGDQRLSKDLAKLPKTSGRCEKNPRIAAPNRLEHISQEDTFIRYTTENGSLCDTFSYQNLLQDQAYLVLVTSRNLQGLPLNICITNFYSKRCDIYTKLAKSNSFTTEAFLIPPMGNVENGYDVNINNLSIRGTVSVNDLKSIVFVPFTYNSVTTAISDNNPTKSTVEKIAYREINPSLYGAEVNDQEVLALNFSNEQGWKAYSVGKPNILNKLFPFIFGRELKQKVVVNNWANGWQTDGVQGYVLIVYLPQYLEYIGIILTTASLAFISLKMRSTKV